MQSKFFLDQFHKIPTSFLSSFGWLFKNWGIIFIFLKPYFFGISFHLDGPLLFLPKLQFNLFQLFILPVKFDSLT